MLFEIRLVKNSISCLPANLFPAFLSELGLRNHPDPGPGLRGGLPAGLASQEERSRIVNTARELRQQTQQTRPQASRQHPQNCKQRWSTAVTTLRGGRGNPISQHFVTSAAFP